MYIYNYIMSTYYFVELYCLRNLIKLYKKTLYITNTF